MNIEDRIRRYTKAIGISAFETSFAGMLAEEIKPYCDSAWIDDFGNVIGVREGAGPDAPKLMLEAHMDQIGLMISHVQTDGRLSFVNLGGVDERILPYTRVSILAQGGVMEGVIEAKQHDGEKSLKIEELLIHTGLPAEEVKMKIRPGDTVLLRAETEKLMDDTLCGSAMDNRAGVAAIVSALAALQSEELPYTLYCVFTTQEELGLHGAFAVTGQLKPDLAAAVDVTHGMTPDTKDKIGVFPLRSGAAICRGPNFDYQYTRKLISLAEKKGIPHTIEVAGGSSGTTAWAIQLGEDGIPMLLLSVPLRYMHTNVETLAVQDVESVCDLLTEIVKGGLLDAE